MKSRKSKFVFVFDCKHLRQNVRFLVGILTQGLHIQCPKGAPCARRAHFHGRVHDFWRCAPGVCRFLGGVSHYYIVGECMKKIPGAQF